MQKHFSIVSPNITALHYEIDPFVRVNLPNVLDLIAQRRYFVLHAPRQTGKTSCLLSLRHYLNSQSDYAAVYVNIEGAQAVKAMVEQTGWKTANFDRTVGYLRQRIKLMPARRRMARR
jgi:hypothetical protein